MNFHNTRTSAWRFFASGLLLVGLLSGGLHAWWADVNFAVSGTVPGIRQPTSNTCWATAATMMSSWKSNTSKPITDVMKQADTSSGSVFGFAGMFAANKGLLGARKPDFLGALSLRSEGPMTLTAAGWESLLKSKGPLWVTTNEGTTQNFAIHARVMIGIAGDGSGDGTLVTFMDPNDGAKHSETLAVFTKKFEDVAIGDLGTGADLRPQIVHF